MKVVRISAEALDSIRSKSEYAFHSTGEKQSDGSWLIPLRDSTLERLQERQFPGETLSDTIIRLTRRPQ